MRPFVSIQTKLIRNTMTSIAIIFVVLLSVLTFKDVRTVNQSIAKAERNIRNALLTRGNTLIRNNSRAMASMIADNAFTAVQELVASTVSEDPDIVYGIFMDSEFLAWAHASAETISGVPQDNPRLTDDMSVWSASLTAPGNRQHAYKGDEVIEFAAPVEADEEILGWIRYGMSSASMREALEDAMADGIRTRNFTIRILLLLGVVSLLVSYLSIRRLAAKITGPIQNMVLSVTTIARGNYDTALHSGSNDELGTLAKYIDAMRMAIKDLTDNLEAKVDKRTQDLQNATNKLADANTEISALNEKLKGENLRLSAELDIAQKLQEMVLPGEEELKNIADTMEIVGFMEPADEVGGDYYDVLKNGDTIKIGIGDVTGHGLESGVLMMMTQTVVRTLLLAGEHDPKHFLDVVNQVIYSNVQRMNGDKTMSLSLLDYHRDGHVKISGQHEDIIIVRCNGDIEFVDTADLGFPIGLVENIAHLVDEHTILLESGDGVVLYSDGITEAENSKHQLYGQQRLCEAISRHWETSSPEEIKNAVIQDVYRFIDKHTIHDDLTLVVLKHK